MISSRFRVALLLATLTTSALRAQDVPAPRFGLGATGMLSAITAPGEAFVGVEGFMRLGDDPIFRTRIDAALYASTGSPFVTGCLLSTNSNDNGCGSRKLGSLATVMATALVGPRRPSGLRPFYFLVGAGIGVTTSNGAAYYVDNKLVRHKLDMGPTVLVAQGGFGWEFHAFRIESRVFMSEPATSYRTSAYFVERPGAGISFTLGRVW
jgi:hypothetical protein